MRNLVEEALARSGSWESIIQWAINEARNESFSESFADMVKRERRRAARIVRDYKCCQHRHYAAAKILNLKSISNKRRR